MDRVLVRLPSPDLKIDLLQGSVLDMDERRLVKPSFSQKDTVTIDVDDAERARLQGLGAVIYEDVQFRVAPCAPDHEWEHGRIAAWADAAGAGSVDALSLSDVVEQIGAPRAWERTRGRGVTIAVVDTGVADGLREVPRARRSPINPDTVYRDQHWIDSMGHGSMCAAIAAGSTAEGGRYDGVAPEATVLSARSSLKASDLLDIYDELMSARANGNLQGPLVVTNSYALYTCRAPDVLPEHHPYISGILAAIEQGIFVCFAAGNNHYDQLCRHEPSECGPNSIWGPNSHDRVVSVGTVNRDLTNCDPLTPHANSSRGPGEWAKLLQKPDCVAPTYGEVPWGASYRRMNWWGTSGACPQVAGQAALILSVAPALPPARVAEIIRASCSKLPLGKTCVGHGLIDCSAAIDATLAGEAA